MCKANVIPVVEAADTISFEFVEHCGITELWSGDGNGRLELIGQ